MSRRQWQTMPPCLYRQRRGDGVRPLERRGPGVVYLVEDMDRPGMYKVGETRNIRERLFQLAGKLRIRLVWFIVTNCRKRLERHAILNWADHHVVGEWFRLGPEQVAWFKAVRCVNWLDDEPVGPEWDVLLNRRSAFMLGSRRGPKITRTIMVGEEVPRKKPPAA